MSASVQSSPSSFDPSMKEEVSSWIQNEQQCVTAHRISQAMSISRTQASLLLQEILQEKQFPCQITTVQQEEHKHSHTTTVFRLTTSTKVPDTLKDATPTTTVLFAVAPGPGSDNDHSPEAVSTAHERDMVAWREMVQEGRYNSAVLTNKKRGASSISNSSSSMVSIDPADALLEWLDETPNKTMATTSNIQDTPEADGSAVASSSSFVARSSRPAAKKTTTTAASFFAAHKTKKTTQDKHEGASTSSKTPATTSSNKLSSSSSSSKSTSTTTKPTTTSTTSKPKPSRNEKENKINHRPSSTTSSSGKVGNADDFVGDFDDDDDDDEIEVVPPTESNTSNKKTKKQDAIDVDNPANDGEEDEDAPKSEAANRASTFIPTNFNDPNRKRKRRKKLVEKTTMQNGYLHTETQAIWEDVPTDEEEEEEKAALARHQQRTATTKRTNNSKASGGKSNKSNKNDSMKQKSLMGFFAKK